MDRNQSIDRIISQIEAKSFAAAFMSTSRLIDRVSEEQFDFSTHAETLGDDDEYITEEIEDLGLVTTSLENACDALLALDTTEAITCLQAAKR